MTFGEGKRINGTCWSVAIPDGFHRIDSEDDRPFELVPCTFDGYEPDMPIRLLPGAAGQPILGKNWMHHNSACSAIAAVVGKNLASQVAQTFGCDVEVVPLAWADICGWIMIQNTGKSTYGYQITAITDKTSRQLRVQTGYVTEEQKQVITASVIEWVKSFRFASPNGARPAALIDGENCFTGLCKGNADAFEAAVEQAKKEYMVAVQGHIQVLQFHAEQGLLNDSAYGYTREFLGNAMELKEYYAKKIHAVVKRLDSAQVKPAVKRRVAELLEDFMDAEITELTINDEPVGVPVPAALQEIYAAWNARK
jgi:hypothetical protein